MYSVYSPADGLWLCALVVALAVIALPIMERERTAHRSLALLFTAALAIRYLCWRATATMNGLTFDAAGLWVWTFFVVEVLALANSLFTYLLLSRWRDRTAEADLAEARLMDRASQPSVDVFIATYNEGSEILERTILGARSIDYPNFVVWVLDDGRRDWLRERCAQLGVRYLRRPDGTHAKAGNLNHALRHTGGDFILVLDADFVAHRNILKRTVGLFEDSRIGAIQTPQVFFNPDPIQSNLGVSRSWYDEQRFFFDVLQPAKDAWNTAFCCGTGAVIRRAALEQVGGFPTATVTEDIHLTYVFYEAGYITRYLNESLNMGLAAEGVSEYLTQRSRWCLGTLQQLFLRTGPFGLNRQTVFQRINYLSGVMFWVLLVQRLMFITAPLGLWYFDVITLNASVNDMIFYFGPYLVSSWLALAWISRGRLFPLVTEVSQLIVVPTVVLTLVQILVSPFGQPFKVTPKGAMRDRVTIHGIIVTPATVLILLLCVAMGINSVPEYATVAGDAVGVNFVWSFINIALLALAILIGIDRPRYRSEERFDISEITNFVRDDGTVVRVRILDLSLTGARIAPLDGARLERTGDLVVSNVGAIPVCRVSDRSGANGIQFSPLSDALRSRLINVLYSGEGKSVSQNATSINLLLDIAKFIAR